MVKDINKKFIVSILVAVVWLSACKTTEGSQNSTPLEDSQPSATEQQSSMNTMDFDFEELLGQDANAQITTIDASSPQEMVARGSDDPNYEAELLLPESYFYDPNAIEEQPLDSFFPTYEQIELSDISNNQFLMAAKNNDVLALSQFLKQSQSYLLDVDDYGNTALHLAAYYGATAAVSFLLDAGINVNESNNSGQTAFELVVSNYPISYNQAKNLNILIGNGSNKPNKTRDFDYLFTIWPNKQYTIRFSNGDSALHLAAYRGHLGIEQFLIDDGIALDYRNNSGDLAIHSAVRGGNPQSVDILVNAGLSIEAVNNNRSTPLHLAFDLQHPRAMVLYLLNKKANVNSRNIYRNSPLIMLALTNQSVELAQELIIWGAQIDAKNSNGNSALYEAMNNRNQKLVAYLLSQGASPYQKNKHDESPLILALNDDIATIDWFLAMIDLDGTDKDGNGLLHIAILSDISDDNFNYLFSKMKNQASFDIDALNDSGQTALQLAILHDKLNSASVLANNKANLYQMDITNNSAMDYLVDLEPDEVLSFLAQLPASSKLSSEKETPLFYALANAQYGVASALIDEDRSILQQVNSDGATALNKAAALGNEPAVDLLLSYNDNCDTADRRGNTPLHNAIISYSATAAEALLEADANSNAINNEGKNAAYLAIEYNNFNLLKELMATDPVDIYFQSHEGNTLLHEAVRQQNSEVIEYLLSKGLNPSLENNSGYSAIDLAKLYGNETIITLLLKGLASYDNS